MTHCVRIMCWICDCVICTCGACWMLWCLCNCLCMYVCVVHCSVVVSYRVVGWTMLISQRCLPMCLQCSIMLTDKVIVYFCCVKHNVAIQQNWRYIATVTVLDNMYPGDIQAHCVLWHNHFCLSLFLWHDTAIPCHGNSWGLLERNFCRLDC